MGRTRSFREGKTLKKTASGSNGFVDTINLVFFIFFYWTNTTRTICVTMVVSFCHINVLNVFCLRYFKFQNNNLWTKQPTWCQLVVEYMSTRISPSNQFLEFCFNLVGKCVYTSTLPCRDHMLRFTYLLPHLNKNPMIKLFQSTSHHWGPTKGCRTVLAGLWRTLGAWVICRWTKIQLSSWHL